MQVCTAALTLGLLVLGGSLTTLAQTGGRPAVIAPFLASELRSPLRTTVRPTAAPSVSAGSVRLFSSQRSSFTSETRVPVAAFLGGRFAVEGFKQQVATQKLLLGLPDSTLVKQLSQGTLRPRGESLYGLRISFRLDRTEATGSSHFSDRIRNLFGSF